MHICAVYATVASIYVQYFYHTLPLLLIRYHHININAFLLSSAPDRYSSMCIAEVQRACLICTSSDRLALTYVYNYTCQPDILIDIMTLTIWTDYWLLLFSPIVPHGAVINALVCRDTWCTQIMIYVWTCTYILHADAPAWGDPEPNKYGHAQRQFNRWRRPVYEECPAVGWAGISFKFTGRLGTN